MIKTPLRAAIYCRISKDTEGLELGVERQQADCLAFAKERGHNVVGVFIDNDISASTRSKKRRPEFENMLARARSGDIDVIIAYTSGRLTRRPRENEDLIEIAEKHGVRYEYLRSPSFDLNTADGRNIARILAANDAAEAERTSERVIRKLEQRTEAGLPHNGYKRFGYLIDEDGTYKVNEGHRKVVQDLYTRWVAGDSFRVLSLELNAMGVRTLKDERWEPTSLRHMMDQGFAAGLIRERSNPDSPKWRLESYDTWRPGNHEAIISLSLWDDYKARRLANNKMPPRQVGSPRELTGLLMCGAPDCSGKMVASVNGNGHQGWQCKRVRDLSAHPSNSISLRQTAALVMKWLEENIPAGDVDTYAAEIAAKYTTVDTAPFELRIKELNDLKLKAARLVMSEAIGEDEAKTMKAEYDREITELQAMIAEVPPAVDPTALVRAFTTLRREWDSYPPAGRREALSAVVRAIYVVPKWADGYAKEHRLQFDPIYS